VGRAVGATVGATVGVGVTTGVGVQFAVPFLGESITIMFEGEELPEASPLQPEKVY
jgi:hypothetical protein